MSIIPKARPRLEHDKPGLAKAIVQQMLIQDGAADGNAIMRDCPVALLGVRGYYPDSFKRPRLNDFGVYDDAMFLITPTGTVAFNANVDPSKVGWNPGVDKYYAQLTVGVWPFRRGPHKGVSGHFRQLVEGEARAIGLGAYFTDSRSRGAFTVKRVHDDETAERFETGYFAINIHEGTQHGTSSWGCQTMPPDQFAEMRDAAYAAMTAADQRWLPCVLVAGPI